MTNQSLHTTPIPAWRPDLEEYAWMTGRFLPATMHPQQVRDFIVKERRSDWEDRIDAAIEEYELELDACGIYIP